MRTQQEIDVIIQDVQKRLTAKSRAMGIALSIPQGGYVQDDDWLNIVVSPDSQNIRAHQYVDALSDVEKELKAAGISKVLLVPAQAD